MFDRQSTLRKLLKKILRSYSIEAIEDQEFSAFTRKESVSFLRQFQSLDWVKKKGIGIGADWRYDVGAFTASALVEEGVCPHLGAYINQ